MSFKEITQLVLDNKKNMTIFVSFFVIISTLYSFVFATPYYKTIAKIYPVKDDSSFNRSMSDVSPILRSFGAGLNSSYKKIDFYIPDLVKSDMIIEKILNYEFYTSNNNSEKIRLIDFWGMDSMDPDEAFYKAKKKLTRLIDVSTDDISPIVVISIETEDPLLSADIISFMVDEIEDYIVNQKNRLYISKGEEIGVLKKQYKAELEEKQKDLLKFIKKNAKYIALQDLEKMEQMNNKNREIGFDEQAYSFLTRDYIQANIEAQSQGAIHRLDVPKTRVINSENGKAQKEIINPEYRINEQKSSPKRALIVILTFITSTFSFIYYLLIRRKFAQ